MISTIGETPEGLEKTIFVKKDDIEAILDRHINLLTYELSLKIVWESNQPKSNFKEIASNKDSDLSNFKGILDLFRFLSEESRLANLRLADTFIEKQKLGERISLLSFLRICQIG